jgi:translocation and assembly module TamB
MNEQADTAATRGPTAMRIGTWMWRAALALLVTAVVIVAIAASVLVWAARSEAGMRTLISFVPGLQVSASRGTLLGDFAAARVEVALPRGGAIVLIEPQWKALRLQRLATAPWGWQLVIDRLEASHVQVRPGAPAAQPQPLQRPRDLILPIGVEIGTLRVGELMFADSTLAPLRDLQAGIHLAGGAGTHRIDALQLSWDRLQLRALATIGSQAPLTVQASAAIAEVAAPATSDPSSPWSGWTAQLTADGTLERLAVTAALRAHDQALDASAEVTPFAPLPVSRIDAHTEALDLAALVRTAPKTSLSGRLQAALGDAGGAGQALPLTIAADLRNAIPGRWDAGRLPLKRLQVDAIGNANDARRGELRRVEIELGSAAQAGGIVSGGGRWDGERWSLDARLQNLAPDALDRRAPPIAIDGTLQLKGVGAPAAALPLASAASAAGGAPASLDAVARLRGRSTAPKPAKTAASPIDAWQLELDAGSTTTEVQVRKLQASSAGASARFVGEARREAAAPARWHLRGEASLANADAGLLGRGAAALKGTASRLNGGARFDVRVPERLPAGNDVTAWLAAWRGNVQAALRDSQLAGVPLEGELQLASTAGGNVDVSAALLAAGNRATLRGELDAASAAGTADRWTIAVAAPALAALAPALQLWRPDFPVSGALTATARLDGRWPALSSRGELQTATLALPGFAVSGGSARWNLGTSADARVEVQLQAERMAIGAQQLESATLQVDGTGSRHSAKLRVDAVAPAAARRAPGTSAASASMNTAAAGATTPQRLTAHADAQGGWTQDAASGALGWSGRVQRLDVQTAEAAPAVDWLRAEPFDLEWSQGTNGQRLKLSATRLHVLDAVVRLQQLDYAAAAGQPTAIEAQAELEPLSVAPLLARLQPDFGWGGTLTIGGRLTLRSAGAAGFSADGVLERVAGDLSVTDPSMVQSAALAPASASAPTGAASAPGSTMVRGVTQRLGLRELRLSVTARDGIWRFGQQLQGRNLGTVDGQQTVHAAPGAVWPAADAPLEGRLDVQVDNLATWGGWVPAGWRLLGQLALQARVGGRFGAPEYTGRLTGSGLGARHLLAGIDVRDGDMLVLLEGPTARIERFVLTGGDGTVRLEGRAEFGAVPRAQLQLVAERFRVLGRVDRRVVASGEAHLELQRDAVQLDGRFVADEGLVDISAGDAPTVSDDVTVVGRAGREEKEAAASGAGAPRRNISLKLELDLGQRFRLRGRGLDTLLRGSVVATAPGGKPSLVGTIRTENGTFNAYAQKLTIERGSVMFTGPINDPRLDILALRTQSVTASESDVKVGVAITGSALNPRVRLYSEPEMSDTEKLSWLVLGRGPSDLGRTEFALVQQAALALLAGESGGNNNVLKNFGLDELSVRQNEGDVRDTVVAVGKQLSERWYVGYERSLTATTGTWQIIYRVARRYTLRAQTGLDNAFDVLWTWRWQ